MRIRRLLTISAAFVLVLSLTVPSAAASWGLLYSIIADVPLYGGPSVSAAQSRVLKAGAKVRVDPRDESWGAVYASQEKDRSASRILGYVRLADLRDRGIIEVTRRKGKLVAMEEAKRAGRLAELRAAQAAPAQPEAAETRAVRAPKVAAPPVVKQETARKATSAATSAPATSASTSAAPQTASAAAAAQGEAAQTSVAVAAAAQAQANEAAALQAERKRIKAEKARLRREAARLRAEKKAQAAAERKAKAEAARQAAKVEAARQAKIAAERKAKVEAERKSQAAADEAAAAKASKKAAKRTKSAAAVAEKPAPVGFGELRMADRPLMVRAARDKNSKILKILNRGQRVRVDFRGRGWYAVFDPAETTRDLSRAWGYSRDKYLVGEVEAPGAQPEPAAKKPEKARKHAAEAAKPAAKKAERKAAGTEGAAAEASGEKAARSKKGRQDKARTEAAAPAPQEPTATVRYSVLARRSDRRKAGKSRKAASASATMRVRLDLDSAPSKTLLRQIVHGIWRSERRKGESLDIEVLLKNMDAHGLAYAVARFDKEGRVREFWWRDVVLNKRAK